MQHRYFKAITAMAAVTTVVLGAMPHMAAAASYPTRSIDLVVPYAPGGTTDLVGRIIASKLSEELGQSVIVLNQPGAGGAVGSSYAARQKPDGYTIVMAVESSHAVNPSVQKAPAYDPVSDFSPISNLVNVFGVLDVNADSDITTFDQLLTALKKNPEGFSFGSSGTGGYSHLFGESFLNATDTKMLHVPYKGLGPAVVDLMAGQINVVFDNLPSSAVALKSGKLRALAVSAPERIASLPDVPTYAEVGYPELNTPSWFGLAAPAGVSDEVLDRLNEAVKNVLSNPDVVQSIEQQGAVPAYTTREEFADMIRASNEQWSLVVSDINFEKL